MLDVCSLFLLLFLFNHLTSFEQERESGAVGAEGWRGWDRERERGGEREGERTGARELCFTRIVVWVLSKPG